MTDEEAISNLIAIYFVHHGTTQDPTLKYAIRAIRDRAAFAEAWDELEMCVHSLPGRRALATKYLGLMQKCDPRKKADDDT